MHKKLSADLISLAHSILRMKDKDDVLALKEKAKEVHEKLAVLAYVEYYINTTPQATETKEELLAKIEAVEELAQNDVTPLESAIIEEEVTEKGHENFSEAKNHVENESKTKVEAFVEEVAEKEEVKVEDVSAKEIGKVNEEVVEPQENEEVAEVKTTLNESVDEVTAPKVTTLEEELQDAIAVDVVANLFDSVPSKSLNDTLQKDIQIGLNDRIAFVNQLFEGSHEDFNRVVSQLNTFHSEKEAMKFVNKMVKPDYNWSEKEELENRFISIIERKFA